jgi:phenylacetic acid degradation operon negative regulatory protein
VLLSALLGESPPALPVRRLVRLAGLFGINENQARVALSRMAARGEVELGPDGQYALAGRLLERSRRLGTARSAVTGHYDGTWHVVVVTASGDDAPTRRERRVALRAAALGELREGVWVRPTNLAVSLDASAVGTVERFVATPASDPGALARAVFDLSGWSRRARALCDVLDRVQLGGMGSLSAGFELDADVLRHLQRDPLIPAELLGPSWVGGELRERYEAFDAGYRRALADAHRSFASASAP